MEVKETALKYEKKYTYADYESWDDGNRYELTDGKIHMMSPPSQKHQEISGELFVQFHNFLRGKACKVLAAPFAVRLNADKEDDTIFEPDLLVVCDKSKLDGKRCNGAPDLVIEILSPSTASRDRVTKFNKYLQAGVREYWIVDPESKTVSVHILENGKYVVQSYGDTGEITVSVLEGCIISAEDVFAE